MWGTVGSPSAPWPTNGVMITDDPATGLPPASRKKQISTRHGGRPRAGKPDISTDQSGKHLNSSNSSLGFIQINLNKQHQATKDLGSYICRLEKPLILVQEPHVSGKGVISKGSYWLKLV